MIQTQVMIQRVMMFLREFREYVTGRRSPSATEIFDNADFERRLRIMRNRSRGAKQGHVTRKLNAAKRSEQGEAVRQVAPVTSTEPEKPQIGGPTQPATWDDHDFDTVPSA